MLFGDKTLAIFDIWSFEHFLCGIVLSFLIGCIFKKDYDIFFVLLLSCFWECLEHYLEEGLCGAVIQNWLSGTEYWGNRLIGDNLMIVAGWFTYRKCPKSIHLASIALFIFLLVHLCYPSSMDVQKFLF